MSRRANSPARFTGTGDSRLGSSAFTFDHARQLPAALPEGDLYRPSYADRRDDHHDHHRAPPTGPRATNYRGRVERLRGGGRFPNSRPLPPPAHDREILKSGLDRAKTPELLPGMATNGDGLEVPNDAEEDGSGEAPMEMSDSEEQPIESNPAGASNADLGASMAIADAAAKEQLPVETEKKKPDVIAMLREAKAKAAAHKKPELRDRVKENDDFISLGFDDPARPKSDSQHEDGGRKKRRRLNDGRSTKADASPAGSYSHKDYLYSLTDDPQISPAKHAEMVEERKIERQMRRKMNKDALRDAHAASDDDISLSDSDSSADSDWPWRSQVMNGKADGSLDLPAYRKRKFDEVLKKGGNRNIDGNVTVEWSVTKGVDPVPWQKHGIDHAETQDMNHWLHKEIIDFMSYIQPRAYEHAVRTARIHHIRNCVKSLWSDADVRVFGSFPAELYLPTSDLDLVIVSDAYATRGIHKYDTKSMMFKLRAHLQRNGITTGPINVIGAKVPILKFQDAATNLSVDISFEMTNGLIANGIFRRWRDQYPAMPVIVTIIKQFLAMRNLNEVYQGGMGSYSITCLVISLLQHLPSVRSGQMDPTKNLGLILLEFLDLYGNNFDMTNYAIRVDSTPCWFPKDKSGQQTLHNPHEMILQIQDPMDPTNNISRSSFLARMIFNLWSEAAAALKNVMQKLNSTPVEFRRSKSILACVLGGNFQEMERKRAHMLNCYRYLVDPTADPRVLDQVLPCIIPPPPLENLGQPPLPPGPPPPPPSNNFPRGPAPTAPAGNSAIIPPNPPASSADRPPRQVHPLPPRPPPRAPTAILDTPSEPQNQGSSSRTPVSGDSDSKALSKKKERKAKKKEKRAAALSRELANNNRKGGGAGGRGGKKANGTASDPISLD